ncbi:MAG TPA: hypothetical protein DCY86_19170 [Bdellovibrionales bacterium]|nr:hypothetical protein [Bdellovibrionales bacterium]
MCHGSFAASYKEGSFGPRSKAIFLHHSTGEVIWKGGVEEWFKQYNQAHHTQYVVEERAFPSGEPYPWENYPYDYWNIWVKNAGPVAYKNEPTLEILTKTYDVIVWKHCFPVSNIQADKGAANVASSEKTLENYKLQYAALKEKMHSFPNTRFLIWTATALTANESSKEEATRARAFVAWVKKEWDSPKDNIFLWDFWELETEGGLNLPPKNAEGDSHPNAAFGRKVAPLFSKRLADIIEGKGDDHASPQLSF